MNFVRTTAIFATFAGTTIGMSVWAAGEEKHESHRPAAAATNQVAAATAAAPEMGEARRHKP